MELLLEIQANQLGVTVHRSALSDTTALGAAYLAGLAEGVWADTTDIANAWTSDLSVTPTADRGPVDALHARWLQALGRSRGWAGPQTN